MAIQFASITNAHRPPKSQSHARHILQTIHWCKLRGELDMTLFRHKALVVTGALIISVCTVAVLLARARSFANHRTDAAASRLNGQPQVFLWAWERPTDLRFIDPRRVGVAFLAERVFFRADDVIVRPRLQSLDVPS